MMLPDEPDAAADAPSVTPHPTFPAPQVAHDATVGPLLAGSGKQRSIFAARTGDVVLEHLRAGDDDSLFDVNEVQPMSDADVAAATFVPGDTLYGGAYTNHFGHMLAEGMHRLWAAVLVPELRTAPIALQVREGRPPEIETWMVDILAQFGIAPDRLLLVDKAMRFERLHVPKQGRVLGGAMPFAGYAGLFPLLPLPRDPAPGRGLYVSRRNYIHRGSYLGESAVESMLRRAGYDIVYPEILPLATMLGKIAAAERVVFCEGSAIHHLELTGPIAAPVFVISRRAGTRDRFRRLLDATTPAWTVFEAARGTVCLEWDKIRGAPFRTRACSFTDLPALVDALSEFSGFSIGRVENGPARRSEQLDLLRYMLDPAAGSEAGDAELGRLLRALRDAPEVQRLFRAPQGRSPASTKRKRA